MANTYTLISSNVLTGNATSITFSSIPSTYTDLVLKCSIRDDRASQVDNVYLNFNNDSSALYSFIRIWGDGATASANTSTNATAINAQTLTNAANSIANTFSNAEIYIPYYNASQDKQLSIFTTTENNSSTAYMGHFAALYRSSTAISSIQLTPVIGPNFVAGSSFYLYGIKNS